MAAPTPYTSSPTTIFSLDSNLSADINALIAGVKWGDSGVGTGATVYYSFPISNSTALWDQDVNAYFNHPSYEPYSGFRGLNATQQTSATELIQSWANVANLNVIKVDTETASAVGDIRIAFTSSGYMDNTTYAYTYYPGASFGGDVWLNSSQPVASGNNFSLGGAGYHTILHELGHALGLSHPFDTIYTIANPTIENYKYTAMSYSDAPQHIDKGNDSYYPTTPMLLDIQAIQYLYGANMSYHAGDDVYIFNGTSTYYQTIWDAGGTDTIVYSSSSGGVINLNAGNFSSLGKPISIDRSTLQYDNVAIAYNVTIENAIGGTGNDTLIGNDADNHLTGGSGNDRLDGGLGNNVLEGGDGNDTYIIDSYEDSIIDISGIDSVEGAFSLNLSDTFYNNQIENITLISTLDINANGNALANVLTGNAGNNILDGGAGVDTLLGGLGDDTYIVDILQSGVATKSIDTTPVARLGLFASLNKPAPTPAAPLGALQDTITEASNAGTDTLELRSNLSLNNAVTITLGNNLEHLDASHTGTTLLNLTGNTLNNTVTGNDANNTLDGATGVDTLVGGLGDDTYLVDIVASGVAPNTIAILQDSITEYVNEGSADMLKLRGSVALTNATTISLNNDLANIEHLDISATGTTKLNIEGNDANNILIGNAATNTLIGGNGNDRLDGGLGSDILDGGDGDDTYLLDAQTEVIIDSSGNDTIQAAFSINLTSSSFNQIENTILTGIAAINATGNEQNNNLTGNDGANTLDGGVGADDMVGGKGNDIYIVDNIGDTATEELTLAQLGGIDLVKSSVDFTLSSNLDNLTLTDGTLNGGTANINGTGNELNNNITGNAGDNVLEGAAGNDTLLGGDGADTLTGGAGVDALTGGKGNDTYNIDLIRTSALATSTVALQDMVSELANPANSTAEGIDTIILTNLTGNAGAPIDTSNITNATTLTVNANVENFDASQTGNIKLNITGNTLSNTITGNDADNILLDSIGNDTLNGGAGNDTLDGGLGIDTLVGGTGNDTYLVDIIATTTGVAPAPIVVTGTQLQDSIVETNGTTDGIDTLKLRGSVTIPAATAATEIALTGALANIENLDISLTGTTRLNITGNAENNILTGNAANNTLTGGNGNDTLDGGLGADTMDGGDGDDKYVIDNLLDVIQDSSGSNDTAEIRLTTGTYTLNPTSDIENVILAGVSAINATGNASNNSLTGNVAANILNGNGGTDTLTGGDGSDTYITDGNDTVIETNALAAGGIDLVKSSVSYTLTSNVENLTLTDNLSLNGGTANINGTGNEVNNIITGNAGNNILDGGAGVDSLIGGLGDDTYIVDILQSGVATKSLDTTPVARLGLFASLNKPAPTAPVGALQDTITEASNAGTDTLELRGNLSFNNAVTITLGNNLEYLDASHTGTTLLNLTGNTLNNTVTGNDANNILDGGLGVDTLVGGTGNDIYLVDIIATTTGVAPAPIVVTGAQLQDSIVEINGTTDGIDTLKLRGSVTIPAATAATEIALTGALANIENLDISLTGTTRLNITGNAENNILTGNAANNTLTGGNGNDTLDGGLGADTMDGGDGDDKYVIDNLLDVIQDSSGSNDTAEIRLTTGTYTLNPTSDIENVILAGVSAINATGNASNNSLTGNVAANILNGNGGTDTLTGWDGNDTYIIDGDDTVIETNALAAGGIDLVKSSVNYTLTSNVENLTLTDNINANGGTANINGTGNALNNIITGNAGDNVLDGKEGNDTLIGGDGNDTLTGGAGIDILNGGAGHDTYVFNTNLNAITNKDTIQGFNVVDDQILLDFSIFNAIGPNLDVIEFRSGAGYITAATADQRIIFNTSTGALYYDADGLGGVTATQFATLTGTVGALTNNSFSLGLNFNITGTDQADTLNGTIGNDSIIGLAGNDIINGGTGADIMYGDLGEDTFYVDNVDDIVLEDYFYFNESNGYYYENGHYELGYVGGHPNNANIIYSSVTYTADFGIGNLTLTGSDNINGYGSNLKINIITGNDGNNILDGGVITNPELTTNEYHSPLSPYIFFIDNGGNDTLIGGKGDDTYIIRGGETVIENSGEGIDTYVLSYNTSIPTAFLIDPNSEIENFILANDNVLHDYISGTNKDNLIIANNIANNIYGLAGNDELKGLGGDDKLYGMSGNDILWGGAGNDTLIGEFGADTFVWSLADKGTNALPSLDKVTDFNLADGDILDLHDLLVNESSTNILNFLDITTSTTAGITNTEIRISNTGGFAGGTFAAAAENQHITLAGVNLLTGTNEADLLTTLITQNKLIIDV